MTTRTEMKSAASRSFKRSLVACVAVAGILSGCATTSGGPSDDQLGLSSTVVQGCVGGAVAGALLGAALNDDNRGEGALVGALVGLAVGCTAGQALNSRRMQYAADAEFYAAQIDMTRQTNVEVAQINADTYNAIQARDAEIARLRAVETMTAEDRAAAQQQYESANYDVMLAERRLEVLDRELEIQTAALEIEAPRGDVDKGTVDALSTEVEQLRVYVEELRDYTQTATAQRDAIGQFV